MKKKVLRLLECLFILMIIVSLFNIYLWYRENKKVKKIVSSVSEYLVLEDDGYKIKEEEIRKENEDTVGWLKVEGTNIDYPVVQAKDNDYYLSHDYYKNKNSAGWVFMDSRNRLNDNNIIIYGHHRKDRSMFGDVDKLLNKDFYKSHDGKILLIVGEENIYFEIFSVYSLDANELVLDPKYDNFNELKEKSLINFQKKFNGSKTQLITLITCHSNNKDRLVVVGYRSL